jgi:hypothetical protein
MLDNLFSCIYENEKEEILISWLFVSFFNELTTENEIVFG